MSDLPSAASLFRSIGLMADGPTVWGRPVPAQGPGVFVLELPRPLATAPIELTRVGKWIERVETLRLDGERPSTRALAARLGAYWLPSQTVVYIGATDASVGRRVASIAATNLGDRRPSSSGHWLKTLRSLEGVRVWWALTDATEEYEDALLAAFADNVPPAERAALPDPGVVLPFANLRRPTGERRVTGLTGSLLAEPVVPPAPPTHLVVVPDGDADGARGEPPAKAAKAARTPRVAAPPPVRATGTTSRRAAKAPITLTADGAARMREELDELRDVRRPEVIARIRAAKELGDLKENADYTAAREEQSFLEGRIQALEARLRDVIIAEARAAGMHADIGSVVTVSVDGVAVTYTLVGSAEADAGAGRLSIMSPVGRALVGSMAGDEVAVETPRGRATYDVIAID